MKIETLRDELEMFYQAKLSVDCRSSVGPDFALREFASRVGITLEEPEPTLEERHPRPWHYGISGKLAILLDANGGRIDAGSEESQAPRLAAYNRETLLLEIAEAANLVITTWLAHRPVSVPSNIAFQDLAHLLHRLSLEQREEKG